MVLHLDNFIRQLLAGRGNNTVKKVKMDENDMKELCIKAREIFLSQPNLLELGTPIVIAGDIHGQYGDLLKIFDHSGYPPKVNYLFLGDYVDRGKHSLETISLLLAYKVKYPENFFLLRGNHECGSICKIYGFYDECKRRYGVKLFKTFTDVFDCMPFAAVIDEKIFCCHGGISPDLHNLSQINQIPRPIPDPLSGLACDLLWSDPCKHTEDWEPNDRGISYLFGEAALDKFLNSHDLDLMVRGHQVVEDGYEFFGKRKLITIFSAPNYCGQFDNAAAMMSINEDLMCSFKILTPKTVTNGNSRPITKAM